MKKVTDKKKLFMIVSICILCITLIGGTLAYYRTVLFADLNVGTITHGLDYYITYIGGQNIDSATLERVSDYTQTTSSTEITFYKKDNTYDIYGHIYLDINSIGPIASQSSALKYTVVNSTTGAKLSEGTLAGSKTNDSVLIAPNIPLQTTEELFKIYIWIDENEDINPAMEGETLSLTVRCEATMKKLVTRLVDHLTNLYLKANPTQMETANNGINYYYAESVSMMNDGMNSSNTWEDGANAGNIRYYGSTPNNYIDIGDRDASGNVIPWRIIGVFKNMTLADGTTDTLVKVIRDEPLSSTMGRDDNSNDWHTATLQTYLNTGEYYTGLSPNVKDKIATVEWNLGGWDNPEVYSNFIYEKERGSTQCYNCVYNPIWEGNIALMYPSDYGYAADLTSCSSNLLYYEECVGTNWLYNNKYQWLLTPYSSDAFYAWLVRSNGSVNDGYDVDYNVGVSPVLYLTSELSIESGDGSEGNPYKLDPEPEKKETLTTHITNLYLNNKDENMVTNNDISYRYARIYDNDDSETTSGGLMNDRHGSMDTGEDNGNIRYYGTNPNNYIYFNCSDYSNQSESTCEVWRIIGVFDGKVKIMRNGSIGDLAWDQDKNQNPSLTTYNNDWSTSSLQEFLNGKYYDRGEDTTYTYYNGSDGSSSVDINLESIGIKNDITRGLISESLWYLKGWNDRSIYSDQMYDYERNIGKVYNTSWPTTMPGNIAIPYASDYGYAVDLGSCSGKTLDQYNDTTCTSTNWMKSILGTSSYGWLMAPNSSYSNYAWNVISSGYVNRNVVCRAIGVAPVLHLNSELGIKTGDGSQDTPYQIAIG